MICLQQNLRGPAELDPYVCVMVEARHLERDDGACMWRYGALFMPMLRTVISIHHPTMQQQPTPQLVICTTQIILGM